jgi:hypothetical protein
MTQATQYIWQRQSWPEFRWDNAALLKQIGICRFQQGSLLTQMKDLGFDVRQQARAEVLIEEGLKTSEIDRERLDPKAIRSSVGPTAWFADCRYSLDKKSTGGHLELLNLIESAPHISWHYRRYGVRALVAMGKKEEAIKYVKTSCGLNDSPVAIDGACEEILLSFGLHDEAPRQCGAEGEPGRHEPGHIPEHRKKVPDEGQTADPGGSDRIDTR